MLSSSFEAMSLSLESSVAREVAGDDAVPDPGRQ